MTKWSSTHTDYYNSYNHIAFPLLLHHCFLFVLLLYSPFFLLSAKWYHKNLNYYLEPFLPPSDRLSFISVTFANSVQLKFLPGSILPLFYFLLKTHRPHPPPMFFSASLPRCWVHYTLIRSRVLFFSFSIPLFWLRVTRQVSDEIISQPFHSQDLTRNSPYFLSYSSYDVSSENLVLDQVVIP